MGGCRECRDGCGGIGFFYDVGQQERIASELPEIILSHDNLKKYVESPNNRDRNPNAIERHIALHAQSADEYNAMMDMTIPDFMTFVLTRYERGG
jgi:hypothetical protein